MKIYKYTYMMISGKIDPYILYQNLSKDDYKVSYYNPFNSDYVGKSNDPVLHPSDGVKIDKKYSNLYEYNFQFSSDIKQMLSNGELGLLLIKIVDIVGESNLEDLDINTVNLLVSTMNELKNVDLRNEILIEVLPLKV